MMCFSVILLVIALRLSCSCHFLFNLRKTLCFFTRQLLFWYRMEHSFRINNAFHSFNSNCYIVAVGVREKIGSHYMCTLSPPRQQHAIRKQVALNASCFCRTTNWRGEIVTSESACFRGIVRFLFGKEE